MEIKNEEELKKVYRSIIQNKSQGNKDCPDFDYFRRSFADELDEKEKFKIIDHITKCTSCFKIFNLLKEFSFEGEKTNDSLGQVNLDEIKNIKEISEKKLYELEKKPASSNKDEPKEFRGNIRKSFYSKFIAMAAAVLIIVVGITFIAKYPEKQDKNILRGQNDQEVRLISPKGKTNIVPVIFRWSSVKETLNYQVVLIDNELTEIWLSAKINDNSIKLPDNILKKIKKGDFCFWKVVLFLKNNKTLESDLQKFSVQKK